MTDPAPHSTQRPIPSRACRALKIVALALVVSAAVIAGGEAFARSFLGAPVNPYTPHPYLARVRTPGYRQMKMSVDDPARPFLFDIDPLGYRGRSVTTVKKPAGTYRIFFVGASTTENQQVEEERTFPGIVERVLNERTHGHPRVEVANAGIVGYGIERSFALVSHQILQLEPDLIIVNDGGIDMLASLSDEWDPADLKLDNYVYSFKEWLCTESRLAAVLDARFSVKDVDMRRRSFEKKRKIAQAKPYFVPQGLDLRRGLALFRAYLRRLALVTRDAGVPLTFLTQATIWKKDQPKDEVDALWMGGAILGGPIHLDPATLADLIADYNQAIREEAAAHRCGLVDAAARTPKDLDHFIDDSHLTSKGNEVVAQLVIDALTKDGALPGPVPESERPR
jgi:lysophospholipase L1-like esterase